MNSSFAQWYGKFADIPTRFSIKRFLHGLLMKMHTATACNASPHECEKNRKVCNLAMGCQANPYLIVVPRMNEFREFFFISQSNCI